MSTLRDYVADTQNLAVRAEAVAEALDLLVRLNRQSEDATRNLVTTLIGMVGDIADRLDIVNLPAEGGR